MSAFIVLASVSVDRQSGYVFRCASRPIEQGRQRLADVRKLI